MSESKLKALIGFLAFTGNNYISSFFRKGKPACWKILEKDAKFVDAFCSLGLSLELDQEVLKALEEFVCLLYGSQGKSVDVVRNQLFQRKHVSQSMIIDLGLLPPCQSCLLLHSKRANIIAKIWRAADLRTIELPDLTRHSWSADFEIQWMSDEPFPEDIKTILMEPSLDELDDILGEEEDSGNDSEDE